MTFNEAVEEMKALARDNVWSLQYEVASYFDNPQIHGYIAGVGHAQPHNTYQGAIDNMKARINQAAEVSDPAPTDEKEEKAA